MNNTNTTTSICHARNRRYVSRTVQHCIAILVLVAAPLIAQERDAPVEDDFYITITATDVYLCGEGFGGMYGCIDEAISREAKSVVISASHEATIEAVQSLLNAVHAKGFDKVGMATFYESET